MVAIVAYPEHVRWRPATGTWERMAFRRDRAAHRYARHTDCPAFCLHPLEERPRVFPWTAHLNQAAVAALHIGTSAWNALGRAQLVEPKAVDPLWPMRDGVELSPLRNLGDRGEERIRAWLHSSR